MKTKVTIEEGKTHIHLIPENQFEIDVAKNAIEGYSTIECSAEKEYIQYENKYFISLKLINK